MTISKDQPYLLNLEDYVDKNIAVHLRGGTTLYGHLKDIMHRGGTSYMVLAGYGASYEEHRISLVAVDAISVMRPEEEDTR